uniref:Uncharacterized protein n=1 Tax=Strigamia maritima TaxID=126957 RepID=T1IIC2_STRMM
MFSILPLEGASMRGLIFGLIPPMRLGLPFSIFCLTQVINFNGVRTETVKGKTWQMLFIADK